MDVALVKVALLNLLFLTPAPGPPGTGAPAPALREILTLTSVETFPTGVESLAVGEGEEEVGDCPLTSEERPGDDMDTDLNTGHGHMDTSDPDLSPLLPPLLQILRPTIPPLQHRSRTAPSTKPRPVSLTNIPQLDGETCDETLEEKNTVKDLYHNFTVFICRTYKNVFNIDTMKTYKTPIFKCWYN